MAKPAAETTTSQRVILMVRRSNISVICPHAGAPINVRIIPPKNRAKPEPLLDPMVSLILEKRMMPMVAERLPEMIMSAPNHGFPAPVPGL